MVTLALGCPVNLKGGAPAGHADAKLIDELAPVPGLPTLPFANAAEALLEIAGRNDLTSQRVLVTTPNGWRAT
ncbi:hypothetical protein [Paeniglutamicibacter kerguelensis]|uniref:Uncharacterized protein n=1 Tax=Paeniglutamicibacter kerguelensis TaxID=254788 RepID=A0ABS4XG04_9MICC|nr:hypothetical protein [Paeniglutamicibacter kerguelensis]MBP2387271.1 hypothetical protein [Paeniglutamicibacter kerguelensis]